MSIPGHQEKHWPSVSPLGVLVPGGSGQGTSYVLVFLSGLSVRSSALDSTIIQQPRQYKLLQIRRLRDRHTAPHTHLRRSGMPAGKAQTIEPRPTPQEAGIRDGVEACAFSSLGPSGVPAPHRAVLHSWLRLVVPLVRPTGDLNPAVSESCLAYRKRGRADARPRAFELNPVGSVSICRRGSNSGAYPEWV
jgi:hypothetical protein